MLRGLRKVILGQLPEQVIRPAALLALLLLLPVLGRSLDSADDAMLAQVGSVTIAFLCGVFLFFRHRPPEVANATPRFQSSLWLQSCIPFGMTAALQLINGRTDILALGMFRDHSEVGIYRVAMQIAGLVIFGLKTVNAIQGPHVAHLFATGDMKKLQKMITKSSQVVALFALVSVILIVVFGKYFIEIAFGPEFKDAYIPLVILCAGQLVNASMGSVASLLNMTGHERDTTKSIFLGASINVALNLSLTPLWGATGAAIATAMTLITWNLVMRSKVLARIGIETSPLFRDRS
jgi:O-antigen/teichoic acid export membrane protein